MSPEEIIVMARDAGICTWVKPMQETVDAWARFASLVAAREREACKKACEEVAQKYEEQHRGCYPDAIIPAEMGADDCADAIEARGQQ